MRTLIVIPARLAATRLPKKPLRLLGGRPLVIRVWERIQAMDLSDRCMIATDDDSVVRVAREAGAECVLTAAACGSGTERVAEVARRDEFREYDTFVNVQGDEPFIARGSVDGALKVLRDGGGRFEIGTAGVHAPADILRDPNVVKVVLDDAGRALYFSRAPIPFLRNQKDGELLAERTIQHVGVYAYTRSALAQWVKLPTHPLEEIEGLEQLRPLAAGIPIGVTVTNDPPANGIDTEDDLERANARWAEMRSPTAVPTTA